MPSTIQIHRHGSGVYSTSPVEVYLNGHLLSALKSGEQESFQIEAGEHRLEAQANNNRSLEFEFQIREGEDLQFDLAERGINKVMLPLMVVFVVLQFINVFAKPHGVAFYLFMLIYSLFTMVMAFLVHFRKEGFFEWQQA